MWHVYFLFSGELFWIFDGETFVENSPRPLTDLGLPADLKKLDAAFVWAKNRKTYFFSGNQYWRYNEYKSEIEEGYPMDIRDRWRGVPGEITAGFTWSDGN